MATLERVARDICAERGLDFVEILGEGAFKETYHVVSGEGLDVALKLFKSGHSAERPRREIEAMQRCSHASVGKVLEVGEHGAAASSVLFVIEEYLGGGTLTQRLATAGTLQASEVQDLGSALIAAVSHIASLDLVHRDIKPDNILFRKGQAAPVIVDFGLVRDLTSGSLTATWFAQGPGTPYFAAPEQLNNRKELIDWRTDQFAVGVVLSIAAWGRHPYENIGDHFGDVIGRVAAHQGPSNAFMQEVSASPLKALPKLVAPWPVDRHRRPSDLINAWEAQDWR